jgi:endonuclease/exonuclease/phosphatase (EEP) superfamily protein YafD
MNMSLDIANLISVVTGLLVLGACVLFWVRSRTTWVLLALAGQAVSVLCRLLLFVPDVFAQFPAMRLIWPMGAFVFAIGLAGHAWTEYEGSQRVVKS